MAKINSIKISPKNRDGHSSKELIGSKISPKLKKQIERKIKDLTIQVAKMFSNDDKIKYVNLEETDNNDTLDIKEEDDNIDDSDVECITIDDSDDDMNDNDKSHDKTTTDKNYVKITSFKSKDVREKETESDNCESPFSGMSDCHTVVDYQIPSTSSYCRKILVSPDSVKDIQDKECKFLESDDEDVKADLTIEFNDNQPDVTNKTDSGHSDKNNTDKDDKNKNKPMILKMTQI